MAKKLFTVTLEVEAVVVAESEEEAEDVAVRASRADLGELAVTSSEEMRYLPDDWEEDALPLGKHEEKDIGEWIAAGAAEAFVKQRDRLAWLRERAAKALASDTSGEGANG